MGKTSIYTLLLTLLLLTALPLLSHIKAKPTTDPNFDYKVKVEYILTAETLKQVILQANEAKEFVAPPEPSGYKLEYIEISCKPYFPEFITPLAYNKTIKVFDKITSIISYNGVIKVVNNSDKNATLNLLIKTVYVKRIWVSLENYELKIKVKKPEPPFTLSNLIVRVTVDNFLPLKIVDVIDPQGRSLLNPSVQEGFNPDEIAVDLKHVQLKFSNRLGEGEYTIKFAYDENAVLPNCFIIAEEKFYNDTVARGDSKVFSKKPESGWKLIGYVVIVYSTVLEESTVPVPNIQIEAPLVDYVYSGRNIIEIKTISYLVPPVTLTFWVKGYVVFGPWFKVINGHSNFINVMYAPITIKEVGLWQRDSIQVHIDKEMLDKVKYAYLVVQLPSYGSITEIMTPTGVSLGKYVDSKYTWGGVVRAISVQKEEAYVQVKSGEVAEYGTYIIHVKWEPVKFKVLDSLGKPLIDAEIRLIDSVNISATTNELGEALVTIYKPGMYNVQVVYKGCIVYNNTLAIVENVPITLNCEVYKLKVVVKNLLGNKIKNAKVLVKTQNGYLMGVNSTNEEGVVIFEQLPKSAYEVIATYKRLEKCITIDLNNTSTIEVVLDVLVEIPIIGLPLSTSEVAGIIVALGCGVTIVKLLSRRKTEEELEEV